jgi:hypothetical protein
MGRKNSKVRSSNQRRKYANPEPRMDRHVPRVPVEEMVLPDGKCTFQGRAHPKARFGTEAKAAKALAQAQALRRRTGSTHVEKRYYPCPEGGCGGFHLSSRESFDEEAWRNKRALYASRKDSE